MKTNLLVIGYGNELRGDDGVGPAVARAVEGWRLPRVATIVSSGLLPELAERISGAERVVFVDAHVDCHDVTISEMVPNGGSGLGHASDPRWLLALSESLWGRRPRAWLIAVPAESFALGEGLSARAERGMQAALREVARLAEDAAPAG